MTFNYFRKTEGIKIPINIKDAAYNVTTEFNGGEAFELPVKDGFMIQKEIDKGCIDYIVFESLDDGANFDCYIPTNGEAYLNLKDFHNHLLENELDTSSNYTVTSKTVVSIIGENY